MSNHRFIMIMIDTKLKTLNPQACPGGVRSLFKPWIWIICSSVRAHLPIILSDSQWRLTSQILEDDYIGDARTLARLHLKPLPFHPPFQHKAPYALHTYLSFKSDMSSSLNLLPHLISGLAITSLSAAAITCPKEDIVVTQCVDPEDCVYPNPNNCDSFIACRVNSNGKNGTSSVLPCPSGLEWNYNEKICDWPVNSTCKNIVQETLDTAKEVLPPANGEKENGFDCEGEKKEQSCESELECIYANSNEKTSYFQCTSGTVYVVKCEDGLYSDAIKACE